MLPEKHSSCLRHVSFHWASGFTPVCLGFPLCDNYHRWQQPGTASRTTLSTSLCVSGAVGYHPLAECAYVFPNTEEVGDKYSLWSWAYSAFRNSSCSPNLSSHLCPHIHTKGCLWDSSFWGHPSLPWHLAFQQAGQLREWFLWCGLPHLIFHEGHQATARK